MPVSSLRKFPRRVVARSRRAARADPRDLRASRAAPTTSPTKATTRRRCGSPQLDRYAGDARSPSPRRRHRPIRRSPRSPPRSGATRCRSHRCAICCRRSGRTWSSSATPIFDELLDYCRRSANPIGRLLLHLYGVDDAALPRQSDAICTGLQLANFWQDVALDWQKGRVYLPPRTSRASASPRAQIASSAMRRALARLIAFEVERARALCWSRAARSRARCRWRLRARAEAASSPAACAFWTASTPCAATSSGSRPVSRRRDWRTPDRAPPASARYRTRRMTPDEYCQQKAAQSGSSFYYSFLFLPPERRRAITALYAFCREVDDVVDEVTDAGRRAHQARLVAPGNRRDVRRHAAASGRARAATGRARRLRCAQEHFQAVIDGMAMDLDQQPLSRLSRCSSAIATSSPASSA